MTAFLIGAFTGIVLVVAGVPLFWIAMLLFGFIDLTGRPVDRQYRRGDSDAFD